MQLNLKSILPLIVTPIVTWGMSTYAFTEIMKVKMDAATEERHAMSKKLDSFIATQGDHEVRVSVLEDSHGKLQLRVDKIENTVYDRK
ncbi:TPA: hypothetical protein ACN359_002094 [Vibrio parahaemolyticus]|uniref:hypothetical protein n=1 Tax=Vibrio parahaemolyticus TaxID=670 RepID=UPI0008DAE040|nr:hypothetical protein [Vibrio parahaemolyticus]OHX45663.1 hypothetical protein BB048_01320 [Vibrio parahaemolyticus]